MQTEFERLQAHFKNYLEHPEEYEDRCCCVIIWENIKEDNMNQGDKALGKNGIPNS